MPSVSMTDLGHPLLALDARSISDAGAELDALRMHALRHARATF
jgi:hypothetical protein